jgi:hypothetical protein
LKININTPTCFDFLQVIFKDFFIKRENIKHEFPNTLKFLVLKIVGIIKYGVGACAEFVCNVNITAYTPLPDNSHNRHTFIPPAEFEPAIPASE